MDAKEVQKTDIQIVEGLINARLYIRYANKDYYYVHSEEMYKPDPGGKQAKQQILLSFHDDTKTIRDAKRVYDLLISDPCYEITDEELSDYIIDGVNHFKDDDGLIRATDVQVVKPEFIYEPYFPKGKLTLIGAYPGSGKTMLMSYFSAKLTQGQPFFGCRVDKPYNVLYFSTEDGVDDTLQLRFQQAGGNNDRMFYYKNIISFNDRLKIGNLIDQAHADVVIFDPLQSYASTADLNNAILTRQMFDSLEQISRNRNVTVIIVCHFNKNSKGEAITRVLGSTDIMGKARSYIAICNMPCNDGRKFFSHEKSNLAKQGLTQIFKIDPDHGLLIPDGTTTKRLDALTRQTPALHDDKLEAARKLILENVDDNGCLLASEAYKLAEDEDISKSTMKTARRELGMTTRKQSFDGGYIWQMPEVLTEDDLVDLSKPP